MLRAGVCSDWMGPAAAPPRSPSSYKGPAGHAPSCTLRYNPPVGSSRPVIPSPPGFGPPPSLKERLSVPHRFLLLWHTTSAACFQTFPLLHQWILGCHLQGSSAYSTVHAWGAGTWGPKLRTSPPLLDVVSGCTIAHSFLVLRMFVRFFFEYCHIEKGHRHAENGQTHPFLKPFKFRGSNHGIQLCSRQPFTMNPPRTHVHWFYGRPSVKPKIRTSVRFFCFSSSSSGCTRPLICQLMSLPCHPRLHVPPVT